MLTTSKVWECLKTVLDPELHISIVDLGLIYDVSIKKIQEKNGERMHVHILMTLTTPGCPLAGMFDRMVKDALVPLHEIDPYKDVTVELTFDPPWIIDMMNPEARADLGL